MGNCFQRRRGSGGSDTDSTITYGGNVHLMGSQEEWDEKISQANKEDRLVVVNFSAAWCGPCRVIAPLYTELSLKYPQLLFLTVDVDDLMDLSSSWDIHATPTFFFLKHGQPKDKLVGANKPELQKKVLAFTDSIQSSSF